VTGETPCGGRAYRRSPHLVLYWQDEALVVHNYATRRTVPAPPVLLTLLERFGNWCDVASYLETVPAESRETLAAFVERLAGDGWLWSREQPPSHIDVALADWGVWNPAAGFFHAATKDTEFIALEDSIAHLADQAKSWPMPATGKHYEGAARIPLERAPRGDRYTDVLFERRTWRQFGSTPLPLRELATLLDCSAGVQDWVVADGEGRVPLKTSPSGGARHPIEVYVAVRHVDGLTPGVYHYASESHALERLKDGAPAFDDLLPTQWWYRDAAALVLFTAVFERTRWRYHSPRAYRAVLIEAGHVCQTFCLTATSLGLAPFCSMAVADSVVEQLLAIDGVSESVLYVAGVGTRAPLSEGTRPGMLPPVAVPRA